MQIVRTPSEAPYVIASQGRKEMERAVFVSKLSILLIYDIVCIRMGALVRTENTVSMNYIRVVQSEDELGNSNNQLCGNHSNTSILCCARQLYASIENKCWRY